MSCPKTNNIIYESLVEEHMLSPTWYQFFFIESVEDGGIWRSWWSTYGGSGDLSQIGVTKTEDVISRTAEKGVMQQCNTFLNLNHMKLQRAKAKNLSTRRSNKNTKSVDRSTQASLSLVNVYKFLV